MSVPVTLNDITSGYNLSNLNTNFTNIQTALTKALNKQGWAGNAMEANLDMDGNNIVNVGTITSGAGGVIDVDDRFLVPAASDPATRDDGTALQAGDVYFNTVSNNMKYYDGTDWVDWPEKNVYWFNNATGTDTLTFTPSTALTAYTSGDIYVWRASATNTGAMTINVSGLGAKNLRKVDNSALAAGDIIDNGVYITLYDGDADNIKVLNLSGISSLASDTTPQLGGVLDTNSNQVRWSKGADVASASSLTLGDDGNFFDITGTTTITGIAAKGVGTVVRLRPQAVVSFTHSATLNLSGLAKDVQAQINDVLEFTQIDATPTWQLTNLFRHGIRSPISSNPRSDNDGTVAIDIQDHNRVVFCGGGSAPNVTLPASSDVFSGFTVTIVMNTTISPTTITRSGSDTIEGATSITLTGRYQSVTLTLNGTNWFEIART